MTHYSDIGFDISEPRDIDKLFNSIYSNKNLKKDSIPLAKDITLEVFHIGEILYSAKLNNKTHQILCLGLGHTNKNLSEANFSKVINISKYEFNNIMVYKDHIPFWFSCSNVETCNIKKQESVKLEIASFPNAFKIKFPLKKSADYIVFEDEDAMADESYVANFEGDQSYAWVSGIITGFNLEKNIITNNNYYSINFDCLGLHFKALINEKNINPNDLQVGKIICGSFWNTAFVKNE